LKRNDKKSNTNQQTTMMSTFTLSPATAISNVSLINNSKIRKTTQQRWTHYVFFVGALFCFILAISQQQQQQQQPSPLFLGTAVTAAVATVSSVRRPASSSVTMMAMTAGSRTLIEIGNNNPDGDDDDTWTQAEYRIDITYLDEDYENGLLILRRANVNDDDEKKKKKEIDDASSSTKNKSNPLLQKTLQAIKNPIVASILIGNIASMIGLIPLGLSGFLPAISIAISNCMEMKTMKWLSKPIMSLVKNSKGLISIALKKKKPPLIEKLSKLISKLYKNRSKYSLLSDYCWYVHGDDENEQENEQEGTK
jgi:hypothetical protein